MVLNKKAKKALDKFVEKYRGNPRVIGILLSGSHVHCKPGPHSDLDVHIVLDKSNYRERGNTWIDGQEIEYFINPVKQIEQYFKEEAKPHETPSTAHMFANCKVLYKKGKTLDRLIAKAKKIVDKVHAKMKNVEAELAKYSLDDLRKDLDDVYYHMEDFAILAVSNQILNKCLKVFFRIKKVPQEKPKRLQAQLKKIDPKFEKLFREASIEPNIDKRRAKLKKLIDYVEKLLGGKRSKEWKLKTRTTV